MVAAVGFDTETKLIEPGCLAPPLVCLGVAHSVDDYDLFHHTEARPIVEALLESDCLLVGDNVAFDFSVIAAKWPDLLPLIFEVYDADRVADTEIRDKLIHLAQGRLRGFALENGKNVKLNYSLADLARRHLGVELKKGEWQLRFGELMDVPLSFWPTEAVQYAVDDPRATIGIFERQEADAGLLADQFRQTRASWWLRLMECWGLTTDVEGVREFAQRTHQKYDELAEELAVAGLVRVGKKPKPGKKNKRALETYMRLGVHPNFLKITKSVKVVQARIVEVAARAGRLVEMTEGGKDGLKPQPKTDADVCMASGDPLLEKYADLSSLGKTLSTDIPLLEAGSRVPLKVHYEVLLETGRTSSTPNVQNLPTDGWTTDEPVIGVRECFMPRPGWIYAVSDYSQFELRTWAQVCLKVLGFSTMAEFLNRNFDPHLEMARRILSISYEEAKADFKTHPRGRVYKPRQASKSGNFGFPGGLGVFTFVEYARTNYNVHLYATPAEVKAHAGNLGKYSEVSAQELRDFWFEAWQESRPYLAWVGSQCECLHPVMKQLFSGRYRGDVRFTEFANGMFQSLAADAAKAAGFLIARACYVDEHSPLFGCRPVNFVHDEFVVEVPDNEYAHEAAEELARLMIVGASPFLPDVPPKAEALLCRRWSKAMYPVRDKQTNRLIPWSFDIALQEAA